MKIAYISNSILPSKTANSIHVVKMCQAFKNNNHEIILLAKTKEKNISKEKVFNYYNITTNQFKMKLFFIKNKYLSLFISFFSFVNFIFKEPYDLIYSRNRHTSFVLSLLGIKHVYEMHGIPKNQLQFFMDKIILKSNNTIVAITKSLADAIKNKFHFAKEVIVAHDGADVIDYSLVKDIDVKGSYKINLAYIGSFLEGKGVDIVCEVSKLLPNIGFHIIGGSDEQIDTLKKEYQNENLFFYGYVKYEEVPSYLKQFDGFFLPNKKKVITANGENIGDYTSPLKLFEYMSTNKPIFLTNLDVFKEVLDENEGFYFESNNLETFKDQIEHIFNSDNKIIIKYKEKLQKKYS